MIASRVVDRPTNRMRLMNRFAQNRRASTFLLASFKLWNCVRAEPIVSPPEAWTKT